MLETTNTMIKKPQFYNTLTHSCTNTLGNHLKATKIVDLPFWKRKFLTGDVDQRLYKSGVLATYGLSFPELRQKANVDDRAIKADRDPQFSQRIRSHLNLNY